MPSVCPLRRPRREERDIERIRRSAAAARDSGQSATDISLAQIRAAFDEAAIINTFKLRVERILRLGADHPAIRARFGARAARLQGHDLDAAVIVVNGWWRDERKAFQIASALGGGIRLSLDVLREVRLILRLMRFNRLRHEYCAAIAALCDEAIRRAAE